MPTTKPSPAEAKVDLPALRSTDKTPDDNE